MIISLRFFLFVVLVLISISSVLAGLDTPTVPVSKQTIEENSIFLVEGWDQLPFKHQVADNISWITEYVNPILQPKEGDWGITGLRTSLKCLSYGSSTTADWLSLETGQALPIYQNILNNRTERGHNPRVIEQVYMDRHNLQSLKYFYAPINDLFVTHENVPWNTKGYSDIITNPPSDWFNRADTQLNNSQEFVYTIDPSFYFSGYKYVEITTKKEAIESALRTYGVLYAHFEAHDYLDFLALHAAALIGYGFLNDTPVFWVHDSYDLDFPDENSRYKAIEAQYIKTIYAFHDTNWPTYNHDNRRTGFTLLKGDMSNANDVEQLDFLFKVNDQNDLFSRSVVSDVDNDGNLDVIFFSVYGTEGHPEGWLFIIEAEKDGKILREGKRSEFFVGDAANGPPVVADTDGDTEREIVVGLANGTLYLIDARAAGKNLDLSKKWSYTVPEHYSERLASWSRGGIGIGIVVQDLDYDGTAEIIFTDEISTTLEDWAGELYVLHDNGNTYEIVETIPINNGGGIGGVSVANIDDDDNLEILVSTYYGVKAFDFANNQLSMKWSNSYGALQGAPVVYDYDRDNVYEILVSTTSYYCSAYRNCADTFYAFDARTGSFEKIIGLSFHSPTTLSVANLDIDSNVEAALSFRYDPEEELGGIVCIDIIGQRIDCEYTNGRTFRSPNIAPVIADIDGNGDNEIIIPENNNSIMHVISGDGTQLFNYSFGGLIGSSPAIADIDNDGRAEIVVKRAGSPYSIMSTLGSNNHQPYLEPMQNMTAIAGQVVTLRPVASDPDNDTLMMYYSAPFNDTGEWIPTANDTGDYTILIEASDGSLSYHQYVPIKVLPEGTQVINVFADGSTNKTLVFTEPGQVQRVTIKIPKHARLVYSTMKIEGKP